MRGDLASRGDLGSLLRGDDPASLRGDHPPDPAKPPRGDPAKPLRGDPPSLFRGDPLRRRLDESRSETMAASWVQCTKELAAE